MFSTKIWNFVSNYSKALLRINLNCLQKKYECYTVDSKCLNCIRLKTQFICFSIYTFARTWYIIFSDSVRALTSLLDFYSFNSIFQRIHLLLNSFSSINVFIFFVWISSHTGISSNKRIDHDICNVLSNFLYYCNLITNLDRKLYRSYKI